MENEEGTEEEGTSRGVDIRTHDFSKVKIGAFGEKHCVSQTAERLLLGSIECDSNFSLNEAGATLARRCARIIHGEDPEEAKADHLRH